MTLASISRYQSRIDLARFDGMPFGGHLQLVVQAAEALGYRIQPWGRGFIAFDRQGRAVGGLKNLLPSITSVFAQQICNDKERTRELLERVDVPVPAGKTLGRDEFDEARRFFDLHGGSIVVKPSRGRGGDGVSVGVSEPAGLERAWERALAAEGTAGARIIVEEAVRGVDLRVYVVGEDIAAASLRLPAFIVGDGKSSVQALVASKNRLRARNPYLGRLPLRLDPEAQRQLELQSLLWDDVPAKDQIVVLQSAGNVSLGGEPIDVTAELHPKIARTALAAVRAIPGLDIAGVDFIATEGVMGGSGTVIEINAAANIGIHHFPAGGEMRDVATSIIRRVAETSTPSS